MLAKVAKSEEMKEFVEVELTNTAFVDARLVDVALTELKLVTKKLVEDPLVIIEEEAKMF